jgi:hypothetical protein
LHQQLDEFSTIRRRDRVRSERKLMKPGANRTARHIASKRRAMLAPVQFSTEDTRREINQHRLGIDNRKPGTAILAFGV